MEGRSGRKVKASSRDTPNKELLKAVYVSRFGKHSPGFVLQYGLRRGDKQVPNGEAGEGSCGSPVGKRLKCRRRKAERRPASPEIPVLAQPRPAPRTDVTGNQHTDVHKWSEHTAEINGRHKAKARENQRRASDDQFHLRRAKPAQNNGTPAIRSQNIELDKHHSVLHVIAKMLEENEKLRLRLLQCSQKCNPESS
ncbi:hypothetical protein XELAEV_18017246mg [Xenopus laevis]|uniref:Uncharacterized protein n=1 Tax=Xenopus laevis TaxID=8355 RepID=A0A974DDJ3_XENLA|nr:hypothetical protein XELAEV_18017246mg [Xenopus laevis]